MTSCGIHRSGKDHHVGYHHQKRRASQIRSVYIDIELQLSLGSMSVSVWGLYTIRLASFDRLPYLHPANHLSLIEGEGCQSAIGESRS